MYIQKKSASAFFKLAIGMTSLALIWVMMSNFGPYAFRLFPTWVLAITAVYFLTSSALVALDTRKFSGHIICPMLDGLLLMSCLLMSGVAIVSNVINLNLPEIPGIVVWDVCLVLPLLILLDYLLFVKKGCWKPMYPFYWLALPLCYAATMVFTAQMLSDESTLRFPLEMLNIVEFGLLPMFYMVVLIVVVALAVGYVLYLADFMMSGKLGKYIVLPHLQVVEVDENGREIVVSPAPSSQSASKKTKQKSSKS